MTTAYIGLGSNCGDRRSNIELAVSRMKMEEDIQVLRVSSLYESDPIGVVNQPRFLNNVLEVETLLSPRDLLLRLLSIEKGMGRRKSRKWGPRTIDLDLLLYGRVVTDNATSGGLILPHPELHRRKFVLIPLLELAPDAIHPQNKRPLINILHTLKDESHGRVEIYIG